MPNLGFKGQTLGPVTVVYLGIYTPVALYKLSALAAHIMNIGGFVSAGNFGTHFPDDNFPQGLDGHSIELEIEGGIGTPSLHKVTLTDRTDPDNPYSKVVDVNLWGFLTDKLAFTSVATTIPVDDTQAPFPEPPGMTGYMIWASIFG
jgi:hypothetical protein